jgi:hypothetical protein
MRQLVRNDGLNLPFIAGVMAVALYQAKEHLIRLGDGQFGIGTVNENLHCLARRGSPLAVDFAAIAANAL